MSDRKIVWEASGTERPNLNAGGVSHQVLDLKYIA